MLHFCKQCSCIRWISQVITTWTSFGFGYDGLREEVDSFGTMKPAYGRALTSSPYVPMMGEGSVHSIDCRGVLHSIPRSCRPPITPMVSKTAGMIIPLKSTFPLFSTTICNRPVILPPLSPPLQPRNCLILLEALENVRRLPPAPSKLTSSAAFECPYSMLLWCT